MPCTSQYSGLPLPAGTTVADAIDVGFPGIVTKLGSVASAEHGIFAGIVGLTAASAREARISVLLTAWAPATPPAEIATATATASARVTAPRPAPAASGCLRVGNRFWNISLLSAVGRLRAPRLGGARLRCARPRGAQPRGAGVHPRARRARAAARHEAGAATPAIRTHLRTDGLRAISITALRNRSGPPPRRPIGSVSRYAGGGGASSWMPGGPPAAPLNLRHPGQLAPPGATRAARGNSATRRSAGHPEKRGPPGAERRSAIAHHPLGDVLGDRQAGGRARRGSVANRRHGPKGGDPKVVHQRAVGIQRLRPHPRGGRHQVVG